MYASVFRIAVSILTQDHGASSAKRECSKTCPSRSRPAILKTLAYIEQNPDESFGIISDKLRAPGLSVNAKDLKASGMSWNFFQAASAGNMDKVASPGGQFYWKDRFQTVVKNLKAEGTIKDLKVSAR